MCDQLKKIKICIEKHETPIPHDNVVATFESKHFFNVVIQHDGVKKVIRYPIRTISRIIEDWT